MAAKKIDLLNIAENIINLDPKMRFAAIIDPKGNIREAIMKGGKTSKSKTPILDNFGNVYVTGYSNEYNNYPLDRNFTTIKYIIIKYFNLLAINAGLSGSQIIELND